MQVPGLIFKRSILLALCLVIHSVTAIFAAETKIPSSYYLPKDHPIKKELDQLFSGSRAILNMETLAKAGFQAESPRKFTSLVVARHPLFPNYIFKIYLDAQRYPKDKPEDHWWALRIQGAEAIRELIAKKQLGNQFKVPIKWIYTLPSKPGVPEGYFVKRTILVEEDMHLFPSKDNANLWKSSYITQELLEKVYYIIKKIGLKDGLKPDNIPISLDGRIAFVDTQLHHRKDIDFGHLTRFLSKDNKKFWKALIKDKEE